MITRKASNILNKKEVLQRIKTMEKNQKLLEKTKTRLKPNSLQDIADEFSVKLGFKISRQAISHIKNVYYDPSTPKKK